MTPTQPEVESSPSPSAGDAEGRTVLDARDVSRALTRISHEILERNKRLARPGPARDPDQGRPPRPPDRGQDLRGRGHRGAGRLPRRHDVPRRPADAPGPGPAAHRDPDRRDRRQDRGAGRRRALLRPHDPGRARRHERHRQAAAPSGSRSWSTAATATFRSGPTSSARTCPPRTAEKVAVRLERARRRGGRGDDPMKKHLLSAGDLTRDDAELILATAEEMRSLADRPIKKLPALRGRTIVNLFFEDSTRTRISFEAAAKRLSADVINFSAQGLLAEQGGVAQGHRADPGGDGRRRGRRPALGLGCAVQPCARRAGRARA